RAQGVPRRAHGGRLRAARRRSAISAGAQRRRVDEAQPVVQQRQPARLQAGSIEALERGVDPAQGEDLLMTAAVPDTEAAPLAAASDSTYLNSRFERVAKVGQRTFQIYRYDPDRDERPRMQTIQLELDGSERMLLDALIKLKSVDPTLSFRRSCREGV